MKPLILCLLAPLSLSIAHADLNSDVQKAAAAESLAVQGLDKWLFLKQDFTHLAKGPLTAESAAGPIKSILAYQKALAAENVQLIVLPVPSKAEIYPDNFSKEAKPDAFAGHETGLQTALKTAGVDIIDLASAYQAKRKESPATVLFCERDAHWSPAGIAIAVDLVTAEVKDKSWLGTPSELGAAESIQITGDLMSTPETQALGPETISIQRTKSHVAPAADAAALLLGDSHTLIFSAGAGGGFHCQDGGILDLLQAEFGQPMMQVANAGGGTDSARIQLARKAFPKPDFWKNKKVVVWCFSVREITEKKWTDVPIKK